jgi:hypothetical protein
MHTIHKLILSALAIYCLASCSTTDFKSRVLHDGKTVIAIVKPVARQLAEDELRQLIEDATK